ncbi:hypothetical protein P153DRAFT_386961 [Dothidotthia symphoricarpi CBS 119687]|uniref:Uncharacterized protein n=1 Tax=Dothidotthia symphoricarpi CBS 119687 TaxID=1392245 RepID=A0A6A6A9X7_9PLEO|nr:uncharacterized protein P153DRAFT_386961 [Dothidotthia symphoricarpi CBS 119687]KAF2127985.1 hypothetical protein P153DRAFT_386961 [Dothidotthia symphoricarpi CBS 119687]
MTDGPTDIIASKPPKQPRTVKGLPNVRMTHDERMAFLEQHLNLERLGVQDLFRWVKVGVHYNSNDRLTVVNNLVARLVEHGSIRLLSSIAGEVHDDDDDNDGHTHNTAARSRPNRKERRAQKTSLTSRSISSFGTVRPSTQPSAQSSAQSSAQAKEISSIVIRAPNSFLPSSTVASSTVQKYPRRGSTKVSSSHDDGSSTLPPLNHEGDHNNTTDVRAPTARSRSARTPKPLPLKDDIAASRLAVTRAARVKPINLAWPLINNTGLLPRYAQGNIRYSKKKDSVQIQSSLSALTGAHTAQNVTQIHLPLECKNMRSDLLKSLDTADEY